jgi:PAS domain S-box-containing protein
MDFFKHLIDSLEGYAILSLDVKGNIMSWNTPAMKIFGYTDKEIIGKPMSTLFTSDYIASKKFERKLKVAVKEGVAEDEKWYVKKNNQTFWGKGRVFPLKDKNGHLKGFTKILRDLTDLQLTDQNRIEKNLVFIAEASKFLSSSLDYQTTLKGVAALAVPHIADWCTIDILDSNHTLQAVAIAHKDPEKIAWARKLRKESPTDMTAKTGLPRVLRTGKSEIYAYISEAMIEASAKNAEQLKLLKSLQLTSVMIVPITVETQTVGAITFINTESHRRFGKADLSIAEELASRASMAIENAKLYESAQKEIASRKKIEEDLRRSELQLKALYESNIVGITHGKLNGEIHTANDAFLQMVGYSRSDLNKGKILWNEMTPLEYAGTDEKALREIKKTGVAQPWEKEFIRKDGSQIPVIVGAALINKNTSEFIAIILDITERKKLEQRKDEFISIASHELKTPLTSIKGYTQILEKIINQMGDERLQLYLKKTNTYINRLNSLIGDLLDVSKIQAGKLAMNFSEFNFDNLVKDSMESIQHINSHHKVVLEGKINQNIVGDKHRLEQVFTNLLSNAIKYSPSADKVVLKISKNSKEVKVAIQDFGVGIPEEKISKLFSRFYRVEETAKKFTGLGIGLYISWEIVTRHKGKMWVDSKRGKGSTFYFTLPIKH